MPIKLLLADDHQIFRESLASILTGHEIEITGQAGNGLETIEKARLHNPDVILMDIGMKDMDGIEATRRLLKEFPTIRVVALSMHDQKNYVKEMLEAGASGYLLKNCSHAQLVEAISIIFNGGKYLSPEITEIIVNDYVNHKNDNHGSADITDREKEVLKLYAEGKTARMIGEKLFISVKTVGTHKQNILKKLSLKTTADLMKYAIKHGIITIE